MILLSVLDQSRCESEERRMWPAWNTACIYNTKSQQDLTHQDASSQPNAARQEVNATLYDYGNDAQCGKLSSDDGMQQYLTVSMSSLTPEDELKKLSAEIAHYQQKYEVQQKRIQFLKRENEQLKAKQATDGVTSQQIKEQNERFKKRNRELKNQLNELKLVMQCVNSDSGPKTATIKDLIINAHTEEVDLPHSDVTDQDIEAIKSFHGLKTLILGQNHISNFGFFSICNSFQDLRKLFINHNQISDDGVSSIVKLKQLKCLDIRCNKITSQALKFIGKLPQLNQLSLSNNDITDSNLEELLQLQELKYLDITSNKITEVGGMVIAQLANLNNLYLSHNKITSRCVWAYFEMPALKVLDVRFNEVTPEERDAIKVQTKEQLQLFL